MGEHFALAMQFNTVRKYQSESQATHKKMRKIHKTIPNSIYGTTIFVLLVIMALGYLIQVNSFSTKGYEITKLQNKVAQLQDQQKKLEIQAANLQSLQRLQSDPATSSMVPVTTVSYVQTASLSQR